MSLYWLPAAPGSLGRNLVERLVEGLPGAVVSRTSMTTTAAVKRRNLQDAQSSGMSGSWRRTCGTGMACAPSWAARVCALVHLAARPGVRPSLQDPELYLDVNVRGTLNVLAMAREFGVPRVVFASSSSVYGSIEGWPAEDGTPCHHSRRTVRPSAGEALCSAYAETAGHRLSLAIVYRVRASPAAGHGHQPFHSTHCRGPGGWRSRRRA